MTTTCDVMYIIKFIFYIIAVLSSFNFETRKFVNVPLESRSLPMESKPKRGRRSQATKAFLFNKFISIYITNKNKNFKL